VNKPVHVLLLQLPQMLRGILEHAAKAHGGCEVLTSQSRGERLLTEDGLSPDVVVLGLGAAEDLRLVPALLARWPRACVMTLKSSGEDAGLFELRPHFRTLGQMSPDGIVNTLVAAVRRRGDPQTEPSSP
jgi:DNA-binding NarL/FixJ family response regulator